MSDSSAVGGVHRRNSVLESALDTFTRFGYRKTSMEEVARVARISRPGLYFLFASKEDLFRAAVERGLDDDLAAVERILGESHRPLRDRMLDSFDRWAGRYIGPMSSDVTAMVDDNPELLGEIAVDKPRRFADLITGALVSSGVKAEISAALAQTLVSTSIGIKHQVRDREFYRKRMAVAIDFLVPQRSAE